MGLLRWLSAVVVAFVLAGTHPALAQGIPDEATRSRVADRIQGCFDMRGELMADAVPPEAFSSEGAMREFIAVLEEHDLSLVADTARQYIRMCLSLSATVNQSGRPCGKLARGVNRTVGFTYLVIRSPDYYLGPDSPLDEVRRQVVDDYLRTCVTAYAAVLDGRDPDDVMASRRQETTRRDTAASAAGTGPLHGSIAFSQDDDGAYAWGIAWSFDSSAGAEAEALGQCREYGGTRCAEAGWFQEACGALAIGDGNGYGTGWGATTGEAERDALAQCRVSNDDCRIEVARCSRSEEAGGRGRTEDQSDTAVNRSSDVAQSAVTSLEPKCPEDLYSAAYERPMKCWLELSNPPGCHYWVSYRDASNLTHRVTWSGSCSGGVADGDGVLTYWGRGIDGDYVEQRDTGVFAAGIRQGRWIGTIDSEYANRRAEGDYLNGSKHGRWQFVQRDAAGGCAVADQFYSHGAIERYGEPREC